MASSIRVSKGAIGDDSRNRQHMVAETTASANATGTPPPLTAAQLQSLARELRSERARLQRSISAARARDDGAPAPDGMRRTPATAEEGFAQSLESRTLARHESLTEALRQLEAGTYGVCARCGRPIPYGRLLLMPEATHCVAC